MQDEERSPHHSDNIHANSDIHISCDSDHEIQNMNCEPTSESEDDADNTIIDFAIDSDDVEDSIASENDRGTCNDATGVELYRTNDLNNECAGHSFAGTTVADAPNLCTNSVSVISHLPQ